MASWRICTRTIESTGQFKRDYERELKDRYGKSLDGVLRPILSRLAGDIPLDPEYRNYALTGDWKNHWDCHVHPDLVLIYQRPDVAFCQAIRHDRSMSDNRITVQAEWDNEAKVYVATSDDVPGLVAEAATLQELAAKLETLVPELLDLNAHELPERAGGEVPMHIMARQVTQVRLHSR